MKNNIYKSVLVFTTISLFVGCKPNLTAPSPSKGSIDPTRYVSIGNSITSGFADGALYYDGQMVSFPNLIAQQFKAVGGGDFKQPLMPQGSIGVGSTGNAPFKLGYYTDCLGVTSLSPIPTATAGDVVALSTNIYASQQGPFNNMGVPGAKAIDIATYGYGTPNVGNPFFTRMASNPSTASILSDAMLVNPTFFTLFIGNNDVLLYATSGAASNSITSQSAFSASINNIVDTLVKHGAKGVIGNVPDITALPFFTTIPWNGLTLTRQTQVDSLNGRWVTSNGTPLYNFHLGNNGFIINDPTVPFLQSRQAKEGDLILLSVPLDKVKCSSMGGWGSASPMPNQYVLTVSEIANIENAISGYNATIKSVADAKGLAFVDVNAFLNQTKTGFAYDGITFNAAFVTGGTFSLDGIHLTPIGNALLANEFIKSINSKYGSTILQVDVTKYHGVIFP